MQASYGRGRVEENHARAGNFGARRRYQAMGRLQDVRVLDYLENAARCEQRSAAATDHTVRVTFAQAARCWHDLARCWREILREQFVLDGGAEREQTARR